MTPFEIISNGIYDGLDAEEILVELADEGVHFLRGPTVQHWSDPKKGTDTFAILGSIDGHSIVCKQQVSSKSFAHMNHEGTESLVRHVREEWFRQLSQLLQ